MYINNNPAFQSTLKDSSDNIGKRSKYQQEQELGSSKLDRSNVQSQSQSHSIVQQMNHGHLNTQQSHNKEHGNSSINLLSQQMENGNSNTNQISHQMENENSSVNHKPSHRELSQSLPKQGSKTRNRNVKDNISREKELTHEMEHGNSKSNQIPLIHSTNEHEQ